MTGRAASIGAGLQAALLLAWGRSEGLGLLAAASGATDADTGLTAARRSFWAGPLCLPAFVALHVLDWRQTGVPAHAGLGFASDFLGFVIGWAGFALLSRGVVARLGRTERWPRYIEIWNWVNVIQYLMLVVAALPSLLGLPDLVSQVAWLVATGWAIWLEWSATRLVLGIPALAAAGLVGMDLSFNLFLAAATAAYS